MDFFSDLFVSVDTQMDADFDPSQHTSSKKKKKDRKKMTKEDMPQMGKKRKKSHFAEVITKEKPVFDPRKCWYGAVSLDGEVVFI